jgi:hypothetical protein
MRRLCRGIARGQLFGRRLFLAFSGFVLNDFEPNYWIFMHHGFRWENNLLSLDAKRIFSEPFNGCWSGSGGQA